MNRSERQGLRAAPLWAVWISSTIVMLGLSFVVPVQAQSPFTPLSSIPGLTPSEVAVGRAVETLCPQLSPESTGGTGDLQIRCTEMIGNALAGHGNVVRPGLLSMAPEEIVAQGTNSVKIANRNIGARLAALRIGMTGAGLRPLAMQLDEPANRPTLVASLAPIAALSSTVPGSVPGASNRLGVFANGTYTRGDQDTTSREAGFGSNSWGTTAGVDYRFTNQFTLGGAFNYMSTKVDFDTVSILNTPASGKVDTQSFGGSIYGLYAVTDRFSIDGIFTIGWNNYDTTRGIIYSIPATTRTGVLIPGATTFVSQTARGDTNGVQYSFSVGASYDFPLGGWTISPLARLEYIKLKIDGYQEKINNTANGFGLALEFEDQDVESLITALGGQASYAISTGIGVLLPQVRLEWRHEFKNDSRTITSRFISDPTRTPILLETDNPTRDYVNLGAGLSATFRGGVAAFVYYETALGLANITAHNVVFGVRLEL